MVLNFPHRYDGAMSQNGNVEIGWRNVSPLSMPQTWTEEEQWMVSSTPSGRSSISSGRVSTMRSANGGYRHPDYHRHSQLVCPPVACIRQATRNGRHDETASNDAGGDDADGCPTFLPEPVGYNSAGRHGANAHSSYTDPHIFQIEQWQAIHHATHYEPNLHNYSTRRY